jgi:hypothetical protein
MHDAILLGTALGAALVAAAAGCGSKVSVDSGIAGGGASGEGGGTAGADAAGGDTASGPTVTSATSGGGVVTCGAGVDVGDVSSGDEPCACEGSFSVVVENACGTSVLSAPYQPWSAHCDVLVAHAITDECKGTYFSLHVLACAKYSLSPCLTLSVSKSPDGIATSGFFIDGSGTGWKLIDVAMPGALPWSGNTAKGTFSATAIAEDGAMQPIKGEYNVCISTSTVCPI